MYNEVVFWGHVIFVVVMAPIAVFAAWFEFKAYREEQQRYEQFMKNSLGGHEAQLDAAIDETTDKRKRGTK